MTNNTASASASRRWRTAPVSDSQRLTPLFDVRRRGAHARERPRPLDLRVNEPEPLRAARGRRCTAAKSTRDGWDRSSRWASCMGPPAVRLCQLTTTAKSPATCRAIESMVT